MGFSTMQGWADCAERGMISRQTALSAHLQGNFYPPLPQKVQDDIVQAFDEYWKGELSIEDMPKRCWLRDLDAVYKYFYCFLDEEDLCED